MNDKNTWIYKALSKLWEDIKKHRIALILCIVSIVLSSAISAYIAYQQGRQYLKNEITKCEIWIDEFYQSGKLSEVIECSIISLGVRKKLEKEDPDNLELKLDVIKTRFGLGISLMYEKIMDSGEIEEFIEPISEDDFKKFYNLFKPNELKTSRNFFQRNLEKINPLMERYPDNLKLQRALMRNYIALDMISYMELGELYQDEIQRSKTWEIARKLQNEKILGEFDDRIILFFLNAPKNIQLRKLY